MKPDFDKMTKPELRAYLVSHPDDQSAFYAFVDRYTADSTSIIHNMPRSPADIQEIERLIREKIAASLP